MNISDLKLTTNAIPCACKHPEHTITYSMYDDEEDVYMYVHLNHDRWYKRVWNALKYIFGYRCKYGHFDEFIINETNYVHFKMIAHHVEKRINERTTD